MRARIDAATLLERAVLSHAATARIAAIIDAAPATRWASATFVGARHRMTITGVQTPAVPEWLAGLVEADLPLRGHLVADLAVIDHTQRDGCFTATVEVLTVEES